MRGLLIVFCALAAYGGIGVFMATLAGKDWHALLPFR